MVARLEKIDFRPFSLRSRMGAASLRPSFRRKTVVISYVRFAPTQFSTPLPPFADAISKGTKYPEAVARKENSTKDAPLAGRELDFVKKPVPRICGVEALESFNGAFSCSSKPIAKRNEGHVVIVVVPARIIYLFLRILLLASEELLSPPTRRLPLRMWR